MKNIVLILCLFVGTCSVFADETAKKEDITDKEIIIKLIDAQIKSNDKLTDALIKTTEESLKQAHKNCNKGLFKKLFGSKD